MSTCTSEPELTLITLLCVQPENKLLTVSEIINLYELLRLPFCLIIIIINPNVVKSPMNTEEIIAAVAI